MEKKLIAGKRYQWLSVTNVPTSRMENGLFTGRYDDKGLAILITRNNDEWHVYKENCAPVPKKGR